MSARLRRLDLEHNIHCLSENSSVFVDTPDLPSFVTNVLPLIKTKFVLVTGVTDFSPGDLITLWNEREAMKDVHMIFTLLYYMLFRNHTLSLRYLLDSILHSDKITAWYAMNCDQHYEEGSKFYCLPGGVSQWGDQVDEVTVAIKNGMGLKQGLQTNYAVEKYNDERWVLSSFSVFTNPSERQPLYDLACNKGGSLSSFSYCNFNSLGSGITGHAFYETLSRFKFVYSPHGRGLDCYRTYEAIYLGSYPIVKTSSLDILFSDLPVLIVEKWEDITLDLLRETYDAFRATTTFKFEKMYTKYYKDLFESHRK